MRIYIAAPLFNESEKKRNLEFKQFLEELGHETYLPQLDGGVAFDLISAGGNDAREVRKRIFQNDLREIRKCDLLFCVLDGRVPDEGVCIEIGMAHALGKICLGYKTDQRSFDKHGDNLMIEGCLSGIVASSEELKAALKIKK